MIYKYKNKNLEKFTSVDRWLLKLKAKQRDPTSFDKTTTKRNALYFLSVFCQEIAKMNPDRIVEERRKQLKSGDEFERRRHEELAEKFSLLLREKGSVNSSVTGVGWLRSFFKHNYVALLDLSVPRGFPERQYKIPTVAELAKLCELAPSREKAWILCQAESGLSNIDLMQINLNHGSPVFGTLKEQLKGGQVPLHIRIVRQKTAATGLGFFDTFFGKNAIEALNEYVFWDKPKLFGVTDRHMAFMIKKIAKKAGVGGASVPIRLYSFRKFFNTYMVLAGVASSLTEYWMGHSLGRVRGAYLVPPVLEQAKVYMRAYPNIDIKQVT